MRLDELRTGAASALIWSRRDDRFLWLLRSDLCTFPLQWCLPGGHIESGESFSIGLQRELSEEIGRDLTHAPIIMLSESITKEPEFTHQNYAICVEKAFTPKLNWEHVDHAWTTLEDRPVPSIWYVDLLLSNEQAGARLKKFMDTHRAAG